MRGPFPAQPSLTATNEEVDSSRHRAPFAIALPSTDHQLAKRAKSGDRDALAAIFRRYEQDLYRLCMGILGEPQDAQDALQNTMLRVLRALPGETREINLKPWLFRIAHNEAIEVRRGHRPTDSLEDASVESRTDPAQQVEDRVRLQELIADMSDLPERQRAVLVMRELSGLGFAEIAVALDTSAGAVRQGLYEARRSLQEMGEGREMECDLISRILSEDDRRSRRRRDVRSHLRGCARCRGSSSRWRACWRPSLSGPRRPSGVTSSRLEAINPPT